jgi:pyrimidine-nucleoside phosphorylase
MLPAEVIRLKRDGKELPGEAIRDFISAYARGDLPDYQMSALAMAVFFRDLTERELAAWTDAMLRSGERFDLSEIPGRKVDKHSTGGVGDKISLPLAPLVAACGVKVPMIAGRGLGHTGGTLDKLESIPGFSVRIDSARFRRVVREVGCVIAGQTESIAPADRRLYALRDVTSTVESIPLIASSIMSKKLAEGIDALVLDVKFGSGAFMQEQPRARLLAETMIGIGRSFGCETAAFLTSMDQPLGRAVGNALEVIESIETLQGRGPADVVELTLVLGAEMLRLGGVARDEAQGRALLQQAIASGAGLRHFEQMIEAQGGDPGVISDTRRLPVARVQVPVPAARSGFVGPMATDEVGRAAMLLGAGRSKVEDVIDPAAGLMLHVRAGQRVKAGETLAVLHTNGAGLIGAARERLLAAIPIQDAPSPVGPLVAERLG